MSEKFYAGIGSRQTPPDVLALMTRVAAYLRAQGWTLRSGHAQGADRAFEVGANRKAVVYLPWPRFGQDKYGDDPGMPVLGEDVCDRARWAANHKVLVALKIRPKTEAPNIVPLMGRNVAQVLGMPGDPPSKFVVCWCPEMDGKPQGGTACAVQLAAHEGIPVFNLFRPEDREKIEHRLALEEAVS
jgi:hypothetical protein